MATLLILPIRPVGGQSLPAILGQFQSSVDSIRTNALDRLVNFGRTNHLAVCSPNASDQVKQSLVAALEKENSIVYSAMPGSLSEAEADEYYGDLIGCVAALHDGRAAHALVGAIETGGGATGGLVALGNAAVPEVLAALHTGAPSRRASAAHTLGIMAARRSQVQLSDASVTSIRAGLLSALRDGDMWVQQFAVSGLAQFSDTTVRHAMEVLLTNDTTTMIREGRKVYPIREAARAWIRRDDSLKAVHARP